MQSALDRPDWLIENLAKVPAIIGHLRREVVPGLQPRAEGRVSGSKDVAAAPLNIDPLDEADELWAMVCSLVEEFAERSGETAPALLRRQWIDRVGSVARVRGFATSDEQRIYDDALKVSQWLIRHAWSLALGPNYVDPVDELVERIESLFGRIPHEVGYRFKAYRPWPCATCYERTMMPEWVDDTITGYVCDSCGDRAKRG